MKKKIFLISGICIGVGALLLTGGLLVSGYKENRTVRNTQTVAESFTQISIKAEAGDITVMPSLDGSCRLAYEGTRKQFFSASVSEGVLTVTETNTRKWYEYIGLFLGDVEATIYLPNEIYTSLAVEAKSGDIEVGQVRVDALSAKASSGSVELSNIQAKTVDVQTSSGDVDLESVTVEESVKARSRSGDIDLTTVRSQNAVEVYSESGDAELEWVTSEGETKIRTTSGSVSFSACDGAGYDVQTTSGSVRGRILTAKMFQAETKSGRIKVPQTATGGVFKVKTSSGNVSLSVAE